MVVAFEFFESDYTCANSGFTEVVVGIKMENP